MTRKQIKFFKHTIIGIGALTPIVLVVFLIFGMARIPANTVGVKVSAFNLTARNSPTSKVAGCKGFGLVQGLAPCA